MPSALRRFLRFLDYFGRVAIIWQFGGAFILTGLVGWGVYASDVMPWPFLTLLILGLFLLTAATIGAIAPHVTAHLPPPPRPKTITVNDRRTTPPESMTFDTTEREAERTRRAAIHEAISTLELQEAEIRGFGIINPAYSGEWYNHRALLAGEPHYDRAVRGMERALLAISRVDAGTARLLQPHTKDALQAIAYGIAALTDSLKDDE